MRLRGRKGRSCMCEDMSLKVGPALRTRSTTCLFLLGGGCRGSADVSHPPLPISGCQGRSLTSPHLLKQPARPFPLCTSHEKGSRIAGRFTPGARLNAVGRPIQRSIVEMLADGLALE